MKTAPNLCFIVDSGGSPATLDQQEKQQRFNHFDKINCWLMGIQMANNDLAA